MHTLPAAPAAAAVADRARTRRAHALVLAAFALALWPHARWAAARLADGSDDPLGLAALAVLALLVWRWRGRLRAEPQPALLAVAWALALAATGLGLFAPPLLAALVAAGSLAALVIAWAPAGTPRLPVAGLAALALPVVSSMQFYAGYPLRVVTAEASAWVLSGAGFDAAREGHAMWVDGRLVIVDAPCSGVQMVWLAWFTACAVAAWRGLPDGVFARRLPWVGVMVLIGNVVRNAMLVGLEARGTPAGDGLHEGIGVAVLAVVCAVAARLAFATPRPADAAGAGSGARPPTSPGSRTAVARRRATRHATVATLLLCAALPLAFPPGAAGAAATPGGATAATEAPRTWDGRPLRPLALGTVEARFAARFPGRIERLTDERSVLVWREVRTPTRMLHPATDCYRGLGYRIADARLERDARARLWRCFVAERDGRRVRVCERIEDASGQGYTDASSWFWAAQLGRSQGPWQAVTVATPLGSGT